jgi:polyhydroxybutyrate depolymerase
VEVRGQSGYEFDRLADLHGFVVVYPDGVEGYWNACNRVGDYAANIRDIDDVGFLTTLTARLGEKYALDPGRVFATGLSRGGSMALRLAIEAPGQVRAVAAIAASVPVESNFKCEVGPLSASVMIMNGVADPLNPFDGGEVALYGMFMKRGEVLSSMASARFFADLNGAVAEPETESRALSGSIRVDRASWVAAGAEIELVAIHGAGHVIPQPAYRYPRLLGPTPRTLNGPEMVWQFFARQPPRSQ